MTGRLPARTPATKTLGFLMPDGEKPGTEQSEALACLRSLTGRARTRVILLPSADQSPAAAMKRMPEVLWWHDGGEAEPASPLMTAEWTRAVREYVDGGGILLLSLCAARYVVNLGLESTLPSVVTGAPWPEQSWAEGYPDMRGFAARGEHPLFEGLWGGTFTWSPSRGVPYAGTYFDFPAIPREGRVLAVEREYLRINTSRPLIVEYRAGRGRVLTIGSNFFFADRSQRFRPHLERLLMNALRYLADSSERSRTREAWTYASPPFEIVERRARALRGNPAPWTTGDLPPGAVHRPAAGHPFALAGKRLLVLGEEKRGIVEAWAHPVRILSDLAVSCATREHGTITSRGGAEDVASRPEALQRTHRAGEVTVEETIFVDPDFPAGAVHYATDARVPVTLALTARIDLRSMWPLPPSSTGTLRYGWDEGLRAWVVTDESGDGVAILGASQTPATRHATPHDGSRREVILEAAYVIPPGRGLTVVFAGGGSGERDALGAYRTLSANPAGRLRKFSVTLREIREASTIVEGPDREFNAGFRQALTALERFRGVTPGIGSSLMAGFGSSAAGWDGGQEVSGRPGYAWYFGRDSVWTSFAFLAAGRSEVAKDVLLFLGAHQDVTGKILHEMTTSGHAHYDAADATPLYLLLMGRYHAATGDTVFVRSQWERLERALAFCTSTDTDGDGLIENTNVGHGWIEGGRLFPSHTELYLASCWCEALRETGRLARALGKTALARRCAAGSARARDAMRSRFWNASTSTYSFALKADGSFLREETILPAVAMYFGHLDPAACRHALDRFASSAFSADWGVRIVGRDSPLYNPVGYHYGSVWPLFTGWTALAEFAHQRPAQGFSHAMANLHLWPHWSPGGTPEVLHGERLELAGVCADQAWSSAMVVLPVLEGMMGLRVDAPRRRVFLAPYFPPDWPSGELRNIRVGAGRLTVAMRRRANTTTFEFSQTGRSPVTVNFRPWFASGTTLHAIRVGARLSVPDLLIVRPDDLPDIPLTCRGELRVTFEHTGGAAIVPPVAAPAPGEESSGLRLIGESWVNGTYEVTLEGKADRRYTFDVIADGRPSATEGAWIIRAGERRLTLSVRFDEDGPSPHYRRKTIRIPIGP